MKTNKNCEYVRKFYGVPAEIGLRVEYNGRPGTIYADGGNYVRVNFDSDKPGICSNIHPTDPGLVYLKEKKKIRKMSKSAARYQEYLDADWYCGTFGDWIKDGMIARERIK